MRSRIPEIINNIENELRKQDINWNTVNTWEKFEVYVCEGVNRTLRKMFKLYEYDVLYTSGSNKFPDIIITLGEDLKIGIEVKFKNSNKDWKILGGSIYESGIINDLDHVFIIFGQRQLKEIRVREYRSCLSDIKITHSPRFFIDAGDHTDSVFERLNVSDFDSESLLKEYKKNKRETLKEGESLWWLDNNSNSESNYFDISLKHYNSLDKNVKKRILTEMFIYFPSILQNDNKKYYLISTFLIQKHNVYHHAIRDFFSAGGKKDSSFGEDKIDAVTNRLIKQFKAIKRYFNSDSLDDQEINNITEMWDKQNLVSIIPDRSNVEALWLEIVCKFLENYRFQIIEMYTNIKVTDQV